MKGRIRVVLALVAGLAMTSTAFAAQEGMGQQQKADQQQVQAGQQQGMAGQQQDLISSDWLVGKTVYSPKAEELGNISNLIMDQKSGNVGYVTISTGGFFDFSDEKQIVPFKALNITEEQVSLNMNKDKFDQAPDWRQGLTVEEFNRETEEFFGVGPEWGWDQDEEALGGEGIQDEAGAIEEEGVFEDEQGGIIEDEGL